MKKTMFSTFVAFFAMLFCARFAAGQTETQVAGQTAITASQPQWCNESCITVPIVNGKGYIRAIEKASAANELAIEPYQFTKLRHQDGSTISPGEAPKRGDTLYLTMGDLSTNPDKSLVAEFFEAEQNGLKRAAPVITQAPKQLTQSATISSSGNAIIPPATLATTKPSGDIQKTKAQDVQFNSPPSKAAIILSDPGIFFFIISVSCLCIILLIIASHIIQGNSYSAKRPIAPNTTSLQMPGKGILGIYP